MDRELTPTAEDVTDLLGKIIGRLEEKSIMLHVLVAMLEDNGILAPGELDAAVSTFLRERGHDYFVETWGEALGEGLYEGMSLKNLQ
jgi:hypothetical protein